MSVEEQKSVADEILARLEVIDPLCIVAGGAPRDWYLGVEAKDIDVFLFIPPVQLRHGTTVTRLAVALGVERSRILTVESVSDDMQYKMNPDVSWVFNVSGYSTPVQIIVMSKSTVISVLPQFPVSVSKIWYKNTKIQPTRIFNISIEKQIIFQTSPAYADGNRYLQKVRDRFPNFIWLKCTPEEVA